MDIPELKDDLDQLINAAELFFQDEIAIDEDDDTLNEKLFDALIDIQEDPARFKALYEFIRDDNDIQFNNFSKAEWGNHNYDVDGVGIFMVLTDEEADVEHKEYEKDLINDIGVRGAFSSNMIDEILDDPELIDVEWFRGYMDDYNYQTAIEMQEYSEFPSSNYVNELHEKLVAYNIMEEPEWPEYEEGSEHEDAIEKLRQKYEKEAEGYIDEYVEAVGKEYDNSAEWYKENFGLEEFKDMVDDNDLWEIDKIIDYVTDNRYVDRATLASYDGEESFWKTTYKNKDYEFYIYQMD
jgi:hypothetical protein